MNGPQQKLEKSSLHWKKIGWQVKRQTGSHKILEREGWDNYVFAFRDSDEIGSKMLARTVKKTGLKASDL